MCRKLAPRGRQSSSSILALAQNLFAPQKPNSLRISALSTEKPYGKSAEFQFLSRSQTSRPKALPGNALLGSSASLRQNSFSGKRLSQIAQTEPSYTVCRASTPSGHSTCPDRQDPMADSDRGLSHNGRWFAPATRSRQGCKRRLSSSRSISGPRPGSGTDGKNASRVRCHPEPTDFPHSRKATENDKLVCTTDSLDPKSVASEASRRVRSPPRSRTLLWWPAPRGCLLFGELAVRMRFWPAAVLSPSFSLKTG